MENNTQAITVTCTVNEPVSKVWDCWTLPQHITGWCNASPDWHTPRAENDLQVGGKFLTRMEAKDGSFGFDFSGTYTQVISNSLIAYTLDDDRKVSITFTENGTTTHVSETFDPENQNPAEMQRFGWQAILDNFKAYTEALQA
jgi:uncharacterized protein YndB with AHSA1/START domain